MITKQTKASVKHVIKTFAASLMDHLLPLSFLYSFCLGCFIFNQERAKVSLFNCFLIILMSLLTLSSVHFSHSVVSNSLRPHGLQHARPPCPSPTPRVYPNSCPLSDAIQPSHPLLLFFFQFLFIYFRLHWIFTATQLFLYFHKWGRLYSCVAWASH